MNTNNRLDDIPSLTSVAANLIAEAYLTDESADVTEILKFLMYFDSNISNRLLKKALEENVDCLVLIDAVDSFITVDLCDQVVKKAIDCQLPAEILLRKVCPYISSNSIKKIVKYSIGKNCSPEILINTAASFADDQVIDVITDYAILKQTPLAIISKSLYNLAGSKTKNKIEIYRKSHDEDDSRIKKKNSERSRTSEKLKMIFENSGIEISEDNLCDNLELDSLQSISVICEIEDVFKISLPDELFQQDALLSFNDYLNAVNDLINQ